MTVAADLTDANGRREVEMMPLEDATSKWPWLAEYQEELAADLAVFSAEGVFVKASVWCQRNSA